MELKRKFTGKHANGVKEYHYESEPNEGMRKGMEDSTLINNGGSFVIDRFLDNCSNSILFGVFDGHGGSKVSDYLSKQFATYFMREYKTAKKNGKAAFESTYILVQKVATQLDQKLKGQIQEATEMGSTATVGLILLQEADRVLYISHVGDSCAYLFDDKGGEKITPEHRSTNHSEVERVKYFLANAKKEWRIDNDGQACRSSRSNPGLRRFRLEVKLTPIRRKFGLSAVPQVRRIELRLHHKYLIVASDGLWDYVNQQEVAAVFKDEDEVDNITRVLIKKALKNGSTDNISVICLKL